MMLTYPKFPATLAALLCAALAVLPARAADPFVTTHVVSEAGAQQVIAAAEREAVRLKASCAIAVVDRGGILVAFVRMDGVREGSPELAIGKARTSAMLERPSAETETNTDGGRVAFVTSGFMALRGGVPLMVNGESVGAVGVASLSKENDVTIAEAAAAAFASMSASH